MELKLPIIAIFVDDEKLQLMVGRRLLTQLHIAEDEKIFTFLLPLEGLEYVKSIPFTKGQLIYLFLDIQMPIMDGYDFLNEFDKLNDDVRSMYEIIITSHTLSESNIDLLKSHMNVRGLIDKPIHKDELLAVLEHKVA